MQKILSQIQESFKEKIKNLQSSNENKIFNEIIEYSFLKNPGKKLRPLLGAIFGMKFFDLKLESLTNFLFGIELVHTYSLVHDDLPALDNDDFRRGLETIHKKFGEYNAILFGDALQSLAFNFFSKEENLEFFCPKQILKTIKFFSNIIGHQKLIYGQNLDLDFSKTKEDNLSLNLIQKIHENKTAVFFGFCASFSGILSESSNEKIQSSYEFGKNFGLAFQILDDIEDFKKNPQKDELNILKFLKIEEALDMLDKKALDLKNFIQSEVQNENKETFLEFIKILEKSDY